MKNWRFNFLFVIFSVLALVIIFRLSQLQIFNNDYWRALAQGQHNLFFQTRGERGELFLTDRQGNLYPLAINRRWEYVFISPREIYKKAIEPKEIGVILAEILNLPLEKVLEKIRKSNSSYEILKRQLSPEEVNLLRTADLTGVYIKEEMVRYYPQDNLASHLVGFLGGKGLGQYGLEGYYNEILEGSEGLQRGERFSWGYIINQNFRPPEAGEDIVLTIDYNIQFRAERLLYSAKEELGIAGGTILVGDPHTGRILAMANYPNFNPNYFFQEKDFKIFKNPTIQSLFEPGSIFKSITKAIALEEGRITPETVYNDTGSIQIGGWTIRNFARRIWGEVDMTKALAKSINTAAVFVGEKIGNAVFLDYLERFEFFRPTGIGLQGEVYSENLSFRRGYQINFANATFGQGIETTALQLFRAFSALANGGKLVNPHLTERDNIQLGERIISQKASLDITKMMVAAVEDPFGRRARVPGYYIAGKTGTSQIAWSALGYDRSGYSDQTIQSFVGYAPALNPSFLILVKLNNPQTRVAGESAAPIFGELAEFILHYYQIPPEREK